MNYFILSLAIIMSLYLLKSKKRPLIKYLSTSLLAIAGLSLALFMILQPEHAFAAASRGLSVWWHTVFPALLPFFIGSEILMGLGVVKLMGTLLEPLMRPVFNVPGEGSFVLAMGLASGYPIGAILTSKLRRKNLCNKYEAERLLCFTNTADPLFMFGAVAVGMFHDAKLGTALAIGHYISSLCVGLTMRFYRRDAEQSPAYTDYRTNIFSRAIENLYQARDEDGRPFGQLLGDSVKQSVNALLMIGGFIIFFAVLIEVASVIGLTQILSSVFGTLLSFFGIAHSLSDAATSGLFEISIGTKVASETMAPLGHKIAMAGAIIAWSGLSVHGQVAAIINDTDINIVPYMFARILHAFLAGIFTLWSFNHASIISKMVFLPLHTTGSLPWSYLFFNSVYIGGITLLITIALGIVVGLYRSWYQRNA